MIDDSRFGHTVEGKSSNNNLYRDELRKKVTMLDGTTGMSRTFDEMDENIVRMASALKEKFGLGVHDTVVLISPNRKKLLFFQLFVGASIISIRSLRLLQYM